MKNFDKDEFGEIFRTGLARPDLSEIDEDWELMKARLQINKMRNTALYYTVLASSIAAILLLVFGVLFNSGEQLSSEVVSGTIIPTAELPSKTSLNPRVIQTAESSDDSSPEVAIANSEVSLYKSSFPQHASAEPAVTPAAADTVSILPALAATPVLVEVVNMSEGRNKSISSAGSQDAIVLALLEQTETDKTEGNETFSKSRFSLAINFAPDLNGVEQLQSNKVSYSMGAGLTYHISKKLDIEAAAAYGKKNYQTGFSSFRPANNSLFQVKPNIVSSGFDVMDLQLNLAYTLFKKGKSSIGFGAGVSSYLMLDEQYSFTYQNLNARGLTSFSTGYQRNHFFGIANLNLSYKRNLTNRVKLSLSPFLKLPLTDLGYGNIRLRSAGMSVGVITDLGKSKK